MVGRKGAIRPASEEDTGSADLGALREILRELSSAPDADSLARRAAELGRERLGLPDSALPGDWFRHPDSLARGEAGPRGPVLALLADLVAQLVDRQRTEDELRVLASTDDLTGVVNRRTALIILEKQVGICGRNSAPLAVCLADIDSLKLVNDRFGHREGDNYIKLVSASIVGAIRTSDTAGRLGGDEFLVVFPDCGRDEAGAIMDRVDRALAEAGRELPYHPALSWGIASIADLAAEQAEQAAAGVEPTASPSVEALLELADRRMYERKRDKGRPSFNKASRH